MRALAGASLALLAAGAAHAQIRVLFSELEAPTPALAERLFGQPMPAIVEAKAVWLPGVAQWSGVNLFFAQHPDPTGLSGLCRVEIYLARLQFEEPREPSAELFVGRTVHYHGYALTGPAPSFAPSSADADAAECRGLSPILLERPWPMAELDYEGQEPEPGQIAFAYRTIMAARNAGTIASRCHPSVEPRCRDPRAFLRAIDLRRLQYLRIAPCPPAAGLCVTAWLDTESRRGSVAIRIETDSLRPENRPARIISIHFDANLHPVA